MTSQETIDGATIVFLFAAVAATAFVLVQNQVRLWRGRMADRRAMAAERHEANVLAAKREIYVYDMEDGVPVNYRAAYPLLRIGAHFDQMTTAFEKLSKSSTAAVGIFAEAAAKALGNGPW